jgi:hypothetical protein
MKILRFLILTALFSGFTGQVFAQPSLYKVNKKITRASKLWTKNQKQAQNLLKDAFAAAIAWTRPEYLDSVREKAFYYAVSCYSPDLHEEAILAANTSLKIFPKGRYVSDIYIYKAIAAFAEGDKKVAYKAIELLSNKRLGYQKQTTLFNGYIDSNHYRSGERFIESQRLKRPSSKLIKDLRRFHKGNARVEKLLAQVESNLLTGKEAADKIDAILFNNYFAKKAPDAALKSLEIKDTRKKAYNPVVLEWCGLERVVKHSASPQLREKKLCEFLSEFPQASAEQTYEVLQKLRNIYLYEMKNRQKAGLMLAKMKALKGFKNKAEFEEFVCNLDIENIIKPEINTYLSEVYFESNLLPYDNHALPVIDADQIALMLAVSNMALGKNSDLPVEKYKAWADLPVDMLYYAAVDRKDRAWEAYSGIKSSLTPQLVKLVEDCIMPLYLPVEDGERRFLAGLVAAKRFPGLATDLIMLSLTGKPSMYKSEHGLAVLSDLYNQHLAHSEAQKVWNQIHSIYPDSIWLK